MAAVLAVVGALAGVAVLTTVDESASVIGVGRDVTLGQVIRYEDLVQVQIRPDAGLVTLPWSQLDQVVGRTTPITLHGGQLLHPSVLQSGSFPPQGAAVIEVSGHEGQMPIDALGPDDRVLVLDSGEGATRSIDAEVVRASSSSSGRTIELLVRVSDAPDVARLSAAGRAVVVLVEAR